MKSYKQPSFQDRIGTAAEAKQRALDNLRSRPPKDEAFVAERKAARLKRDAAAAEKRAAKVEAQQAARQAQAEAKAAAVPAPPTEEEKAAPTEAEKKLARDARYAARKNRR
jgi:hypothetical protein